MKIVVIGGTGLIGSNIVGRLRKHGHETVAASPSTGVNTLTGQGLAEALAGAQVVVDVSNSPSFDDRAVLDFFETSEGSKEYAWDKFWLVPALTAAVVMVVFAVLFKESPESENRATMSPAEDLV